jgi:hypothetical protein
MIGTHNEKAVLILCTYVIGFTTAYIAFGVNATSTDFSQTVNTATVYESQVATVDAVEPAYEAELPPSVDSVASPVVSDQVLSPDGTMAFYCEEGTTAGVCVPFVLDLKTNVSNVLTIDGEMVTFNTVDAVFSWNDDGTLQGPGLVSASADEPWVLVIQ